MVIVTSDSSCDLSQEQKNKFNIPTLPLYVNLGGVEHRDGVDVTPQDIFEFFKANKKCPKTSAISRENYTEFFKSVLDKNPGTEIVHIGLSSGLSTSYNNSVEASKEFGGKVHVVDGKNLSTGTGLLVLYAAELAKKGLGSEEIVKRVEKRVPFVQASFIIQEIEYLYRGGRCSAMAMLGANLLKIKPRIQVVNGVMINNGKPRGKILPVLKDYVDNVLKEYDNPDKRRCFVTHSCIEPEIAEEIRKYVEDKHIFSEVCVTKASSVITSHCGKGTLGLLYINDGGTNDEI